jgi:hypothetical protein
MQKRSLKTKGGLSRMRHRKFILSAIFSLIFTVSFITQTFAASRDLPSYPIAKQEKDSWCWAAVSSSVLKFMASKNVYQCDFVKKVKSTSTCANVSATTTEAQSGMHSYGVSSNYYSGNLNVSQVQSQIDGGHPVYVSWKWNSPTAIDGHAVAIYGYSNTPTYTWYMNYLDPWDGVKTSMEYSKFNGGSGADRTWRWGLKDFWHYN